MSQGLPVSWAEVVVAVTALSSAVLGGALFSFSTFVMQGLGRLEPAEGVRAMQRINEEAPRGLLMLPLLLSPLGSVVTGVLAADRLGRRRHDVGRDRVLLVVGAVLGVVAFLVTAVANIPRNNAIAALDPRPTPLPGAWTEFQRSWTRGTTCGSRWRSSRRRCSAWPCTDSLRR